MSQFPEIDVSGEVENELLLQSHGAATLPVLIYLPGVHGDWTLMPSFRAAVRDRVRLVEFTYPRTLTWSLETYAAELEQKLVGAGVDKAWLLAESFGSQVAWPLLRRMAAQKREQGRSSIEIKGLILAGGFVRYPIPLNVWLAELICRRASMRTIWVVLKIYAAYASFRHRHAPETLAGIEAFLARRTELDRQAAVHRLRCLAAADPRNIAQSCGIPVFYLTGFLDPVVPWICVHPWLRKYCPSYRGRRIVWRADHNVLGTAPRESADQVCAWMRENGAAIPHTAASTKSA
ncbi:MAG: alpha/beta hydrolase [Verrucomicrobiota bacterium]